MGEVSRKLRNKSAFYMYTPPKRQLARETSEHLGGIARVVVKGTQIHTVSVSVKWPRWQLDNQGKWSPSGLYQGIILLKIED